MHVRASHVRGLPIVEESSQMLLGVLEDPVIDPDTGKIHGFFVLSMLPETERQLFLQVIDILSWGTKVHVQGADHLSPPHELVRLATAFAEPRTVFGQPIRTRPGGVRCGRCSDVQFDTKTFLIEWLFPRKFLWMGDPIPSTEILEITKNAIWVRTLLRPRKEVSKEKKPDVLTIGSIVEATT